MRSTLINELVGFFVPIWWIYIYFNYNILLAYHFWLNHKNVSCATLNNQMTTNIQQKPKLMSTISSIIANIDTQVISLPQLTIWSTQTFRFLSPPNSKCLHRLMDSCFLYLHSVHSIRRTIFFVVLAWNEWNLCTIELHSISNNSN